MMTETTADPDVIATSSPLDRRRIAGTVEPKAAPSATETIHP